ncbi:MAG: glycosyltransferase family 39 protein [Planctomycetota bacterium]
MNAEVARREGRACRIRSIALALIVVAFVPRIAFIAARGPQRTDDTVSYLTIAENLREHGAFSLSTQAPYSPTIRRAPAYPWLIALIGPNASLRIVSIQALLDSLVAALVFLLARGVVGTRLAVLGGLLYALHPGAVLASASLLSECLFTVLLTAGVFAFVRGLEGGRVRLSVMGGLSLGLAALCRPIAAPLLFALPVLVCLFARSPGRLRQSAALLLVGLLTITPWVVRSSRLAGGFVLVQGYSAANLYMASRTDWDQSHMTRERMEDDEYFRRLYDSEDDPKAIREADRFGMHLAVDRIRTAPADFALDRASRLPYLVLNSFDDTTGVDTSFGEAWRGREIGPLTLKTVLLLSFALMPLLLGLAGLRGFRRSPATVACAAVWVLTLLMHLPLWIEPRFWWPVIPLLLVSAVSAVGPRQSRDSDQAVPTTA